MEKRRMFAQAARALAAVAGAYLLFRLVLSVGPGEVGRAFALHGWLLFFLIAAYTGYHLLRTWTLRICTPHPVTMGQWFGIRLAGEAVAYIAVGSVFGDALKVILGRKHIPVVPGATGVFAEKLIYHLAGAGFIIGGLLPGIFRFGANRFLVLSMAILAALFLGFLYLLSSGTTPIARLLRHIRERNPGLRRTILETEEKLFSFRREHPREFAHAFLLNFASYFYSVAELMVILHFLNVPCAFPELWYYQAVVKIASSLAMVVPANLGVFEATNVWLAGELEYGGPVGMIVALFVRIRAVVWSIIGYAWFLYLMKDGRDSQQ